MTPDGPDLHDATLGTIEIDWEPRTVALRFDTVRDGAAVLNASGVTDVQVPHREPWGPSVSVNELRSTPDRTEVEMQSGDVIVVVADDIRFDSA